MSLSFCFTSLGDNLNKWVEFYLAFFFFFCIRWYLKNKNPVMMHWPIFDMLPSLLWNVHRIHDWTVDVSKTLGVTLVEKGPVFSRLNILFTCDPQNVEYIVKINFSNFPKGSEYNQTFDILGNGLFNTDFDLWHSQRRMARLTFASKKVRDTIAKMARKVVQSYLLPSLQDAAKNSSVIDLEAAFLRYTFDTIFNILFGKTPDYHSVNFPPNEFTQALDSSLDAVFYRHIVPIRIQKLCRWLSIGNEKKMKEAWITIDKHLVEYVKAKKEDMAKETEGSDDLLEAYMRYREDGESVNEDEDDKFLRDTALTFIFAARDTTGVALSWFFWLVANNPSIEAKIVEELNNVYQKKNGKEGKNRSRVFDESDLKEMVYLHAAVYETLRLYPSLPLNRKCALKEDKLPDGTILKPGMMIIISTYAMGRMEWLWGKDCLEFKPERWIDEDGKMNLESMSKFFTFSVGPRTCLGKDTAFMLIKTAASAILFNFHVQVLEGQNIQPKPSINLKMKNGFKVKITERIHPQHL